jgi:hypothetical protein
MAERITLEVPATLDALSTVRMVLGGLGAGLGYSLDDLEDLSLATDGLFHAALKTESCERFAVEVVIADGDLSVYSGEFHSADLRSQVENGDEGCLDLCRLLRGTVDDVGCRDKDDGGYQVVLVKRGHGGSTTG